MTGSGEARGDTGGEVRRSLREHGWEERFSASGARLAEAVEHYRSLGYEVRVEALSDAAAPGTCTRCFSVPGAEGPAYVIFTRRGTSPGAEDDGLFEV